MPRTSKFVLLDSTSDDCKCQIKKAQFLGSLCLNYQRWSRGHKVRGQGQGHKKIQGQSQGQGQPFRGQNLSRPRTGMLEAKAKDTGAKKKKGLQKFFSGDLQFIGIRRIFDWEKAST